MNLNLRDHFAGLAMQGFASCSGAGLLKQVPDMAKTAYEIADAMIAESVKKSVSDIVADRQRTLKFSDENA